MWFAWPSAARDHNHFCDITLVDLTITELDGKHRTWNLSADVADNVLDGNPHADRLGNKDVWHFSHGRRQQSDARRGSNCRRRRCW